MEEIAEANRVKWRLGDPQVTSILWWSTLLGWSKTDNGPHHELYVVIIEILEGRLRKCRRFSFFMPVSGCG